MSFDSIADLSGLVSECASRADYEDVRLSWLERAVGFEASYFGAVSSEHAVSPVVSGVSRARVEQCEALADRYCQCLLTLRRAAQAGGGVVADHDALSLGQRERMPFYREVIAAHGIRATAVALLRVRGQISGRVFLGRSSRGARFGAELGLLRRALPVLALGDALHASVAPLLPAASEATLTLRERTVLRLLCRGWTNAQIAMQLGSSPHTVKNQVSAILKKTGTRNRTQLTAQLAGGG